MQERQVTIGKETFPLPVPFFVMATQNPIETAGVYSLPEAQVDRFLMKILMFYPKAGEEQRILKTNMTLKKFEELDLQSVTTPK
jgi:MoxR-like ATPase